MGLGAHAEAHPGEVLAAQFGDDALQAVVSAGGAVCADPDPAGIQGDIIRDDENPFRGNGIEAGSLPDGGSGAVHEGGGLHEQNPGSGDRGKLRIGAEAHPRDADAQGAGQGVNDAEAHVVPGLRIVLPGISQAYDEPLGFVSEKKHQKRREMVVLSWMQVTASANMSLTSSHLTRSLS